MQKLEGGDKCLVQILGGARAGLIMDEIDTCIIKVQILNSHASSWYIFDTLFFTDFRQFSKGGWLFKR